MDRDDRRLLRPATADTPSSVRSESERDDEEEAVARKTLTANLVLARVLKPVGFPPRLERSVNVGAMQGQARSYLPREKCKRR